MVEQDLQMQRFCVQKCKNPDALPLFDGGVKNFRISGLSYYQI